MNSSNCNEAAADLTNCNGCIATASKSSNCCFEVAAAEAKFNSCIATTAMSSNSCNKDKCTATVALQLQQ